MKNRFTILPILLIFLLNNVNAQDVQNTENNKFKLKLPENKFLSITAAIDPYATYKEPGIDFVSELEYSDIVYVKVGMENFPGLYGGYFDIHCATGLNLVSGKKENIRYYTGLRLAKVYRGEENLSKINIGLEAGIDIDLNKNFFVGARYTLDKRNDQEIFNWEKEIKSSVFLRIGYKYKWKKIKKIKKK